jgi:hypothetical protein
MASTQACKVRSGPSPAFPTEVGRGLYPSGAASSASTAERSAPRDAVFLLAAWPQQSARFPASWQCQQPPSRIRPSHDPVYSQRSQQSCRLTEARFPANAGPSAGPATGARAGGESRAGRTNTAEPDQPPLAAKSVGDVALTDRFRTVFAGLARAVLLRARPASGGTLGLDRQKGPVA